MDNAKEALLIIQIVLSILTVASILLQVRGSSLGSVFGGGGGEFFRSKRGVEKLLFNATIVLTTLFVLNALALAYVYKS